MGINRVRVVLATGMLAMATMAAAADGLVSIKSAHDTRETLDRFERAAKARGLAVFLRVDHAAGARKIEKTLRPTELLVFGNPQGGTPLMECGQTAGIDLPLKALAWQDESGQVWLSYNDPAYLAGRHGIAGCKVVPALQKALAGLAAEATR